MRIYRLILLGTLGIIGTAVMTGCAAGAATAGYSLKAQSADSLTAQAERRIIEQTKNELRQEMNGSNAYR